MTKKKLLKHLRLVILSKIEKKEYELIKTCRNLSYLHMKIGQEFTANLRKILIFFTSLEVFALNSETDVWENISYILFIPNLIHRKFRKIAKNVKTEFRNEQKEKKLRERQKRKETIERQLLEQKKREDGKLERIYTKLFENI